MPTTYIHANGVKIGHIKDGVRTDYLTDALGSVTATKNQSQQVVNTYRYKPYGGLLAKTGTGDDPRYLWTGNTGSRVTNTKFANQYNVARHYANGPAKWTTVDPLLASHLRLSLRRLMQFTFTNPYIYVLQRPATFIDPTGWHHEPCPTCGKTIYPPIPEFRGQASVDGCIVLEIPAGYISLVGVAIVISICKQCFDTACCKPPASQSCTTFSLGVEFELSPSKFNGKEITDQMKTTFEILTGLFGGLGLMEALCQFPKRECVPPKLEFDLEVCAQLCAGFGSLGGCCSVQKGCYFSARGGFCGFPSLEIEISGSRTECK